MPKRISVQVSQPQASRSSTKKIIVVGLGMETVSRGSR
jgi:hypothetical protein